MCTITAGTALLASENAFISITKRKKTHAHTPHIMGTLNTLLSSKLLCDMYKALAIRVPEDNPS